MSLTRVDPKDPAETKTYGINWSKQLNAGATILACDWLMPDGLTNAGHSVSGVYSLVKIAGGEAGQTYDVVNTITTSDGEVLKRTGQLVVARL
jgi:hypothetical protein